jgi:hypothetical protein
MKLFGRSLALALAAGVLAAGFPGSLHAMFAPLSDRELIEGSSLIVQAEFVGQAQVDLGPSAGSQWLGVLVVRETLKGVVADKIVLIAVPSPAGPRSSSDILYQPGQTGLWFLHARPGGTSGILVADHPQRFVPAGSGQARIEEFRRSLRKGK